jgi:hypothetical protein
MHWPVSRADRTHPRWLSAAAVTLAAVAALFAAPPAGAAVTLGQLAPSSPTPACSSTADYLQPSITGGNLYIARQAGTITSWSTRSSGAGATYVFKVFRRTSDPDIYQVIAHAPAHELTSGINAVPVNIAVRSGDMIGLNESGGLNSCTFSQIGDGLLTRGGSLADGASGVFGPQNDVRLNLSAVLVPSNEFSISSIARDRKQGTATVLLNVSNPGLLTISGKGLKKRPTKNIAVAGTAQFNLASVGKRKRKLEMTGKLTLTPTITFAPTAGEAARMTVAVKLLKRRLPPTPLGSPNAH